MANYKCTINCDYLSNVKEGQNLMLLFYIFVLKMIFWGIMETFYLINWLSVICTCRYVYMGGGHGPGVNTKVLASACYKLIRFIAHNVDSLHKYNDNQHLLTS